MTGLTLLSLFSLLVLGTLYEPAASVPDGDYDPILLSSDHSRAGAADAKLVLFVPGGKVPPQDYAPFVQRVLDLSDANLFGVIVHCGKLNLCDPLGQLPGLISDAINAAGKGLNNGTQFMSEQIFVMGHSLGGVGARHYADTFDKSRGAAAFAGLALFGTQYNGDHEDFKGTLGYPIDLKSFPAPLLAVVGELDMVPAQGHVGVLVEQYETELNNAEKSQKPLIIVPGMDHSQFCSPFNVSGDLSPEIPNSVALQYAAGATATWVDAQIKPSQELSRTLSDFVNNATKPITRAWREMHALEKADWCRTAQQIVIEDLRADIRSKVDINVVAKDRAAPLEHQHTNYTFDEATGRLSIFIASYAYYPQTSSWNPVEVFGPTYEAASDISCKLVSADRIAQQFNVSGSYPQDKPPVTCEKVNMMAVDHAMDQLRRYWPKGVERFAARGLNFTFVEDTSTFAGPQWCFMSSLAFKTSSSGVSVSSPHLYSSITSKIYPGNFYCKVLSPAKALEWIQSKGLRGRYK